MKNSLKNQECSVELVDSSLSVPDNSATTQSINGLPGSIKSSSTPSVCHFTDTLSSSNPILIKQGNNRTWIFHHQIRRILHALRSNNDFLQPVLLGSPNEPRRRGRNLIAILEVKNPSRSIERLERQNLCPLHRNQRVLRSSHGTKIRRLDRQNHSRKKVPRRNH